MPRSAGFTLLELLVVIGVLSVLMGLSVGYLGKTDVTAIANSVLAGELRAAQMTARVEGAPTEVLVRPGAPGEPTTVQGRRLQPVVSFHFEPDVPAESELQPVLGGESVRAGRFGRARRPLAGDQRPLLRWSPSRSVLDLRDGFVARLDVWLGSRGQATVLRYLPAVELNLDEEGRPRARLRLQGLGGVGSAIATVASELALPVARWCTLDVGCDGKVAWLTLDGRELGRSPAEGTPQQEPDSVFEVAPGGQLAGMVDEVRWFVYQFSPPQNLPAEIQLTRGYRFAFDARGEYTERPALSFEQPEEAK